MAEIRIIDRGWKAAMREFGKINRVKMRVGILDNEETARYGAIWESEIGWLRNTTDRAGKVIGRGLIAMQNDMVSGQPGADAASEIGGSLAEGMRTAIADAGLEATGALIESVGSEVSD